MKDAIAIAISLLAFVTQHSRTSVLTRIPLFWRLFSGYLVVHAVLAFILLWVVGRTQRLQMVEQIEERLANIASDFHIYLSQQPELEIEQIKTSAALIGGRNAARITVIDAEGVVLADNWSEDVSAMNNHGGRPEIAQASRDGRGIAYRYSTTEQRQMLYACVGPKNLARAWPESEHDQSAADRAASLLPPSPMFVRASVDDSAISEKVAALQRAVFLFTLIVAAIGGGITYGLAKILVRPLNPMMDFARSVAEGNLHASLDLDSRQGEWAKLRNTFLHMQSELARRERELREYSQRLETILGSMVEGVVAVDRNGVILFANAAARDMLSLQRAAVVGRPLPDVIRHPELLERYDRVVETGDAVKGEFETTGDSRRTLSIRISGLLENPDAGTVIVARDVTELRQLETMRSDFVANVSHELKTPLAAIKAYAETLRLGAMDDKENRGRFLDEIEEQAERLYRLIMDLIQLARIESQKTVFEAETINLAEIVEESVESFAPVALSQDLKVDVNSTERAMILSDSEGLRTILDNLISNAIRYTPDGGTVRVGAWIEDELVGFDVEDTGIGIAPEHQVRVFERFYRVDKARSRDLGGTGLGLSIVKHLCQALGGSIELESRVGVGTKFRVSFPPKRSSIH